MSQNITPFTISAPGFFGLNSQDSPVDIATDFSLTANNCVIDKSGRVSSRKGWTKSHTANTDLSTSNVECLAELIGNTGTLYILAAGGNKLYSYSGTTLTTLTYGGGAVAPTITANNWQVVCLNGIAVFFQRGYDPLIFDPVVSTTTFRRLSEKSGYAGTVPLANCATSAFGRIWCADTATDKNTISFSDVITPHIWTGGTSGTLNLLGVWPHGGDEIVALAFHNNTLVIFGKKQTLVYVNADDPTRMELYDTLDNIGCIARDSVQNTGEDIIFLSSTGVRSLMRSLTTNSQPLREISKNVRDELQAYINVETPANIKSVYYPIDAFYLITCPAHDITYCFDIRSPLEDGSARATTWTGTTSKAFLSASNRSLYLGKAGYIGKYEGYIDDALTYRMEYYSTWLDFGNPIQTSILKKILATVIGATNQNIIYKWGFDFVSSVQSRAYSISNIALESEYGVSEYGLGEYGAETSINIIPVNAGGAGRLIQVGFEADIEGSQISLQKIDIYTKNGRL